MGIKIDCEEYHREILDKVKYSVMKGVEQYGRAPRLLIITIGDNAASKSYVKGKLKDCEEVGIHADNLIITSCDTDSAIEQIKSYISKIETPDGIILQLPVPKSISAEKIKQAVINNGVDVDGFNKSSSFNPCTPLGITRLLRNNYIDISGKHAVIIGRSEIVGRPLANNLLDLDATVTVCHSKTMNLKKFTSDADIIVSCAGQKELITPDMIKDNCILIDVGITKENNKLYGDIHKDCYEKSSLYTTVPKGIGLVTRATLLENILKAYWMHISHV